MGDWGKRFCRFVGINVLLLCGAVTVHAQQAPASATRVVSPILTIDSEAVFSQTEFGRRTAALYEERANQLRLENRQIEADLEEEERGLSDQRADLSPEDFRTLADAFDAKVKGIKQEQFTKFQTLDELIVKDRATFENVIGPVVEQIMREAGAVVILEQSTVFVSARAIDITAEAIARIDAAIGDGSQLRAPED